MMDRKILEYIYLEFLLDPRYPKDFSENSNINMIKNVMLGYFDLALQNKGYVELTSSSFTYDNKNYRDAKSEIVGKIFSAMNGSGVFSIENHPLFGTKCSVNSQKFVEVSSGYRQSISVSDGRVLDEDLQLWGVSRFKNGLAAIYDRHNGKFDDGRWIDFYDFPTIKDDQTVDLPVFDRIADVDSNSPAVVEILDGAHVLLKQLQTGNDLGDLTAEEASAAATEVKQIITAFESSRVRARQLFEMAKNSLSWIASKGAEAMVGALATSLLIAIAAFLGLKL